MKNGSSVYSRLCFASLQYQEYSKAVRIKPEWENRDNELGNFPQYYVSFGGFLRSARQPVLAGGAGYQSHHPVPHENQENVGRGDCEDRSDPRPVTAPLWKSLHIPIVSRRTDDRRDGYGHG